MRIGLLEDDAAIQEMLLLVLQDEGYTVIAYTSADECLEALRGKTGNGTSPVDLMMIDWRLNGPISGTEVIRQIRTILHLHSLPIILTTAATFTDTDELQNLHITLLEKPFALDEVTALVKDMTHSRP